MNTAERAILCESALRKIRAIATGEPEEIPNDPEERLSMIAEICEANIHDESVEGNDD